MNDVPDDLTHPGEIQAGDISHSTGVAIGHGASVTVVNQLLQGLGDLPTRYDGPVRNFLEYYLGSLEQPAPFGGRAADLARLDQWLDDAQAPPYLLLTAPAGRGKSALLAHWVARLTQSNGRAPLQTVFFPISLRFGTNREAVVFAALYARLAHLYGDPVSRALDAQEYRGLFADYTRRPPPQGGRVLLVLDGLDEAAGWEAGADLFPTMPPPHLRVVVAARQLAGDPDWPARLGWETASRARHLSLAGLDRTGVGEVLAHMGNPLDTLATHVNVVAKLYELSEGDPLLVRLYVEALLPQGIDAAAFRPEDLLTLKSGLKPYFDLWFNQQEALWQSAALPLNRAAVGELLNLCAVALGPLTKDDLRILAPERLGDSWAIEQTVVAVNRFVLGDGTEASGYVFSHPRLRDYFAERLTPKERAAWQARFLHYGRGMLADLAGNRLKPAEASAYVVKYYGTHLVEAQAPATALYELLCEGWLRAWEWVEGTPDGFLNDARRVWTAAEAAGLGAVGQQVRSALCFASVAAISANIPTELLVASLRAGVIGPPLALVLAWAKPEAIARAETLIQLSDLLPPEEQRRVLAEALAAAQAIGDGYARAQALSAVAARLPPEASALQFELLQQACLLTNVSGSVEILKHLAQYWTMMCSAQRRSELGELSATLRAFAGAGRQRLLAVIEALLPVIARLGGAGALRETVQAVVDTARWWP